MAHNYTITFKLTEEQVARLMALTVRYNRLLHNGDGEITALGLLESLLTAGSAKLIDERMAGIGAVLDAAEGGGEA